MKLIGLIVLIVLIGGGTYYFMNQQTPSGKLPADENVLGSYAYACTNDVTMRMEPSEDMATVRVMISGAGFPSEAILTHVESFAGARYEGANMMFTGAGEEISIVSGNSSAICNPVPDNESAPFNWGDAGEGGGVVFDPVRVASEAIVGTWNMDDSVLALKFEADGSLGELRDGEWMAGTWTMSAPADQPVVTIMFTENPHGSSCEVATLTPEKLVLRCTGEGEMYDVSYTRAN